MGFVHALSLKIFVIKRLKLFVRKQHSLAGQIQFPSTNYFLDVEKSDTSSLNILFFMPNFQIRH